MTTQAPDATVEALAAAVRSLSYEVRRYGRGEADESDDGESFGLVDDREFAAAILTALPGYRLVPVEEWERLERIESAAQLRRNVITPPEGFEGDWVTVPRADFDALRAALRPLQEPTDD